MKKVLLWLDKHFEEVLMCIFLTGIVVFMSIHVFCRYVLGAPLTWTEEATRYMFIWFVFMGISYGIRNDTHIRVNIIEGLIPKAVPVLHWIQDIIGAAFIFYLFPASYRVAQNVAMRNQTSAGLHLPMQFVYGAVTVGMFLACIRIIQHFILKFMALAGKNKKGGEE